MTPFQLLSRAKLLRVRRGYSISCGSHGCGVAVTLGRAPFALAFFILVG